MAEFIYFCRPVRETFLEDATQAELAVVAEHFEYLKDLHAKGRLILAGRCQDGPPGIVVFEAEDEQAAAVVMQNDPAVIGGIFEADVHPYRVALMRGR
jgi:uncharacterized protein YciI